MIVTCISCQTRFRIPDEKIGPKGARVRCSRCQALFLVRRDDAPPGAAPGEPALAAGGGPAGAPPPPPAPPAPGPGGLELELTDPFGLRAPQPAARADPFAVAAAPDPFAAAQPADPFAAAATPAPAAPTPLPFGQPPPGDPFASSTPVPLTGGIALEEGERRQRAAAPPSLANLGQADLTADFRTPGPSGLEVDDRRTPEQAMPAEPGHAPSPPSGPSAAPAPPAAPLGAIPRPAAAALDDATATVRAPMGRRALAVLVNSLSLALLLVLAGGLYVYWTGGGAGLLAALGRTNAPFEERGVTSGLYDTAGGRPILFVRGRVQARAAVNVPVRVRVELLDGKRKVAQGEGLLGALPSPEEIWSLSGPAEAERLRAELAARAPAHLAAGEARPFLVVLWEYPADLRGLDLRVVAEPAPPG
jgi:predicted Zn finger-like uncharacterized protein